MRFVIQFAVFVQLLCFGATLAAKPVYAPGKMPAQPAYAVAQNRPMSDADRAQQLTNDFAVCVLKSNPDAHERALKLPTVMSYEALDKLARDQCLGSGSIVIPRQLMRGAAYRALYIRDYRKKLPTPSVSPVDYVSIASPDPHSQDIARLNNFGSCVVHANPKASHTLVLADAGTDKDAAAINALRQNLADCLPAGTSVKITKSVLQGLLAEILYREAGEPAKL